MDKETFLLKSEELKSVAKQIPLHWGKVQNNSTDATIDFFKIDTYLHLEKEIAHLPIETQNYFKRRWYIWQCSVCDEYLFSLNENVNANPITKDKNFDIEFCNNKQLQFDVKGTVIPKQFRNDITSIFENPIPMVNFFYEQQSNGVRYGLQNRLFIVHHSFIQQERELYLRSLFNYKRKFYNDYANQINAQTNFLKYKEAKAAILFIIENVDKSIVAKFL
jgi:hypothetical protein